MYGIVISFVATRSGLTRFEDHRPEDERNSSTIEDIFGDVHNKATDEIFYQRAVDYYRYNSTAFVFSVPFEAGSKDHREIYVVGSHALFFGSGSKKAPAAAVGLLIKHKLFQERFFNFSNICMKSVCNINCSSPEVDCYLLDNNGYIIVSEQHQQIGQFFSQVDEKLFRTMIDKGIYREIEMYDYQGICLQKVKQVNSAKIASNFNILNKLFILYTRITIFIFDLYLIIINLISSISTLNINTQDQSHIDDITHGFHMEHALSKNINNNGKPFETEPYPCDKKFYLYEMQKQLNDEPITGEYPKCDICNEKYVLQMVPYTNLLLVVVKAVCPCAAQTKKIVPEEIIYEDQCSIEKQRNDRLRIPPNITCHSHHPEEQETSVCNSGFTININNNNNKFISLFLLLLFILSSTFNNHL